MSNNTLLPGDIAKELRKYNLVPETGAADVTIVGWCGAAGGKQSPRLYLQDQYLNELLEGRENRNKENALA